MSSYYPRPRRCLRLSQIPSSLLSLFLLLYSFAQAATTRVDHTFIYPAIPAKANYNPPNYTIIDTLNATWTSKYNSPNLILWCAKTSGGTSSNLLESPVSTNGSRLIALNFPDNVGNMCHLELVGKAGGAGNNSENFSLNASKKGTGAAAQPTTFGLGKGQQSGTATSAGTKTTKATTIKTTVVSSGHTITVTESASAATNTSSSDNVGGSSSSSSSSGLSSGAKAGIGIGCALAGVALIGGIIYYFRYRRHRSSHGSTHQMINLGDEDEAKKVGGVAGEPASELDGLARSEVPGDGPGWEAKREKEKAGANDAAPIVHNRNEGAPVELPTTATSPISPDTRP